MWQRLFTQSQEVRESDSLLLKLSKSDFLRLYNESCQRSRKGSYAKKLLQLYASIDKETGFQEGMNIHITIIGLLPLVELFLEVLKASKHAKYYAFLTLVYLMHGLNWRCLYIPKYPKLKNIMDILDRRLKIEVPALHA